VKQVHAAALAEEAVVHLRQIMIFGRQPKNRDCVYSPLGQVIRQMNRRQRLVNTVRRATKQTDLLPGNNSDGAVSEAVQIADRRFIAAKCAVLIP
jgi:hypothetical protein